ncbi:MAG: signal recognition particle-docking protein FtsY [Lautropia sp.]
MFGFFRRKKPAAPTPEAAAEAAPPGAAAPEAAALEAATPEVAAPGVAAPGVAPTQSATADGANATREAAKSTEATTATDAAAEVAPAGVAPAGVAPAGVAPAEAVPAETVPAETVPAETVPAETAPAETVPAETAPAETVPAETAPAAADAGAAPAAGEAAIETSPTVETERPGWFARLRGGLSRTRTQLASIFVGAKVDEALYEELETALLASDAGVATTGWLIEQLRARARRDRIGDGDALKAALKALIAELLAPLERPIDVDRARPLVMMIVGVNGAGKTTSIGKLARHLRAIDKTVLLAAGDTFRAAAREQLARWGERNQVQVIASEGGDPAAVAFDAVKAGIARGTGVVMIDTAGRLPTQTHLMDELKKIRRVIGKAMDGAPHEALLVLDGNTGQNMLAQVRAFDDCIGLTGLIVTKLDGTAKGGAIAALAYTRRDRVIPVYFVGVGEGVEDLEAFSAREFAAALLD